MSVHARKRAKGRVAYEVLWRDAAGKQRCETFATRRGADARDREIRALRNAWVRGWASRGAACLVWPIRSPAVSGAGDRSSPRG